jgi:hypothetical protein
MYFTFLNLLLILFFSPLTIVGQENDNAALLKVIFNKYYENGKVIKPGRLQLLNFYCEKAPNNEEVLEVISKNDFLKKHAISIKNQIKSSDENWSNEINKLFSKENQFLKSKVNDCLSFEEFQKVSNRFNLNNQRLLIINKPIYFSNGDFALVKIAF